MLIDERGRLYENDLNGEVAPFTIECGGGTAFAFDPESALLAARVLMDERSVARVPGYCTVSFYDPDRRLIAACDGSQLAAVWAAERG